ncbi:MAG: hypothetical protein ACTIL2_00715 [Corynebacterium sp.]|uniref:hypothetical protein n=1 Tax=Corynebacterium sp. TaxID=1720 RepID=UPI003F99D9F0
MRKRGLSSDDSIVVQATITSKAESLLEEALEDIGVSAELSRKKNGKLAGSVSVSAEAKAKMKIPFLGGGDAAAGAVVEGESERQTETLEELIGQSIANLNWVANAFTFSAKQLVIEDFHYLPEDEQRVFASWMKALGEYGCHVVIIGVWSQSHLLTYFNGDLDGRVDDIHLNWSDADLKEVLRRGAEALKISFSDDLVQSLVKDAYGNVGLLHRLASRICKIEDVDGRQPGITIEVGDSLSQARQKVSDEMAGRFDTFANNFVRGMRRLPEGLVVYLHLLRAFTSVEDSVLLSKGIDSKALLDQINEINQTIRPSDLTQSLDRIDKLQEKIKISPPVLTYHRPGRLVQLVDRSFLFYRKYSTQMWPWDREDEPIENDLADSDPLITD